MHIDPAGREGSTCVIPGDIHVDAERLPRSRGRGISAWKSAEAVVRCNFRHEGPNLSHVSRSPSRAFSSLRSPGGSSSSASADGTSELNQGSSLLLKRAQFTKGIAKRASRLFKTTAGQALQLLSPLVDKKTFSKNRPTGLFPSGFDPIGAVCTASDNGN